MTRLLIWLPRRSEEPGGVGRQGDQGARYISWVEMAEETRNMRAGVISIRVDKAPEYSVMECGNVAFGPGYFIIVEAAKASPRNAIGLPKRLGRKPRVQYSTCVLREA